MNFTRPGLATCSLLVAAACWTGVATAASPAGSATSGVLPSRPSVNQYKVHGDVVWITAGTVGLPGRIRLEVVAHHRAVAGNIATDTYEFIECTCAGYTFDPFAWTATIDTGVRTKVVTTRSRVYPDHREKELSSRTQAGTAEVHLHWLGYGRPETQPVADYGFIYTIPVVYVSAGAWRERGAHVNGVIRFGGLALVARLPKNLPGRLGYGVVVGD